MTPRFLTLFRWHMLRGIARHRLLALLNVVSIALGIAVYLAIQIANASANRSFAASVDLVAGKAQLEIRGEIDEAWWPKISGAPGVRAATAVTQGVVTLPDFPGEYLQVVGIDLFTNEPFRTFALGTAAQGFEFEKWLSTPGGIALSKEFAERHHLAAGDRFRVLSDSTIKSLVVLAVFDPGDSLAATQPRFAAMDLGWAQELLEAQGRLSSIQLLLDDPTQAPRVAEALRQMVPGSLTVGPPRQRSWQMQHMLSAFQLNLSALSMVSLLVGTFLIYTTVSATVTRRRSEIGTLRALGATRLEVRCLFLGEACLFGVIGIALGGLAGVALAGTLVGAVAKTISSLYLLVSIDRVHLGTVQFVLAAGCGFAAVLVGAWLPASEATRIDPVAALSLGAQIERVEERVRRWSWLGGFALALAGGASWAALRTGPAALGFVAAFFVLVAFAIFSPGTTVIFSRAASTLSSGAVVLRLAAENLRRSLRRNGITVAALTCAVAMMTGLTIMIFSFRSSVGAWVERGVIADLFVTPASNETIGLNAFVPPAAIVWIEARPEVSGVDTFREIDVQPKHVGTPQADFGTARLAVIKGEYRQNMQFTGGGAAEKMARVFAGEAVAVTESFARKFHMAEGDRMALATPRGQAEFVIAGVYADYSRDQGVILIARPLFEKFWDDPRVQSLAVYLEPGARWEPLAEAFREKFSGAGEFAIYSNRALRQRILAIFDQTFAVTYVLRTVAVLVALVGIFLSVTTLVTERAREIGVLRAVGASARQIQGLFMAESAMIGALASGLGLASGALLAVVLTRVVNPAFFGWTIALHFPWRALVFTPFWIIPAALAAAFFPARRASRGVIAETIRDE